MRGLSMRREPEGQADCRPDHLLCVPVLCGRPCDPSRCLSRHLDPKEAPQALKTEEGVVLSAADDWSGLCSETEREESSAVDERDILSPFSGLAAVSVEDPPSVSVLGFSGSLSPALRSGASVSVWSDAFDVSGLPELFVPAAFPHEASPIVMMSRRMNGMHLERIFTSISNYQTCVERWRFHTGRNHFFRVEDLSFRRNRFSG